MSTTTNETNENPVKAEKSVAREAAERTALYIGGVLTVVGLFSLLFFVLGEWAWVVLLALCVIGFVYIFTYLTIAEDREWEAQNRREWKPISKNLRY